MSSEEEAINVNLKAGKLVNALTQHKKAILESKGVNSKLVEQIKKLQSIKDANDQSGILGKILAGGLVIGALKSLVSMSPMLKQMTKLMQFSVMLILRPIGDFIGFLLRPIMVFMLRKFIIPWYQDVYPVMKNLGTKIGGALTGIFKNLSGENGLELQLATGAAALISGGIAIKGVGAAGKAIGKIHGRLVRNILGLEEKTMDTKHTKRLSDFQKKIDDFKQSKPTGFGKIVDKFKNAVDDLGRIGIGGGSSGGSTSGSSGGKSTKPSSSKAIWFDENGKFSQKKLDAYQKSKGIGKYAPKPASGGIGKISGVPKLGYLANFAKGVGMSAGVGAAMSVPMMMGEQYAGGDPQNETERRLQEGNGIDNVIAVVNDLYSFIKNNTNSQPKANLTVNVKEIHDKTTADYFLNSLQGWMNK